MHNLKNTTIFSSGNVKQPPFLPMSIEEGEKLGLTGFDVILISGDAYLDHPACATALLGRALWGAGFSVGVIAQPDVNDQSSWEVLGKPHLFFSVSAGSMDSMVAHYTPARKKRSEDAYSPDGIPLRPDRATLVYSDCIHRTYKNSPIVIGGVEASLRRFAHYDYWSDRIRQSVLADAPVDMLVYGMGEQQLIFLARLAKKGGNIATIQSLPGTCYKIAPRELSCAHELLSEAVEIPSFTEVSNEPSKFAQSHAIISAEQNPYTGRPVIQRHPKTVIIQNPPSLPLTTAEIDALYDLPYQRKAHPSYQSPIAALESIRFSITSHRGCYGNCSFCALAMHQGKIIQSRSFESILSEVEKLTRMTSFRGTITDIGGPSANMHGDRCAKWEKEGACNDRECITCVGRKSSTIQYLFLLDAANEIPGVKHVFIGSGIRYDLIPADLKVMKRVCSHVSGQLKVAPEHVADRVTALMNKPASKIFDRFRKDFETVQNGKDKRQYLIPYLMSGHPGCTISDMITLAIYLKEYNLYTEQVQDFTPTPMTTSTCMYATGLHPFTMKPIHIPKEDEKRIQRAMLHWRDPEHYDLVRSGLEQAKRTDLIGDGPECLIPGKRPFKNLHPRTERDTRSKNKRMKTRN
jgi:uncharacterized radical SAM protein YgiQ